MSKLKAFADEVFSLLLKWGNFSLKGKKMCDKRAMMTLDHSPLVPTCDPRGATSFDPKGHHMNEIDKGLQGDATYQN